MDSNNPSRNTPQLQPGYMAKNNNFASIQNRLQNFNIVEDDANKTYDLNQSSGKLGTGNAHLGHSSHGHYDTVAPGVSHIRIPMIPNQQLQQSFAYGENVSLPYANTFAPGQQFNSNPGLQTQQTPNVFPLNQYNNCSPATPAIPGQNPSQLVTSQTGAVQFRSQPGLFPAGAQSNQLGYQHGPSNIPTYGGRGKMPHPFGGPQQPVPMHYNRPTLGQFGPQPYPMPSMTGQRPNFPPTNMVGMQPHAFNQLPQYGVMAPHASQNDDECVSSSEDNEDTKSSRSDVKKGKTSDDKKHKKSNHKEVNKTIGDKKGKSSRSKHSDDEDIRKNNKSRKSNKHDSDDESHQKKSKSRKSHQHSSDEDDKKSSKHSYDDPSRNSRKPTDKSKPKTGTKTSKQVDRTRNASKPIHIIKSPADLKNLGKFKQLNCQNNVEYKAIAKFINNSHDIKKHIANLKIRGIYELDTSQPNNTQVPSGTSKYNPLLLCFKTTPESVKKISEGEDGCVAFYDRIARVLAIRPENLDRPLRQMILLCSVSLGKNYKHKSGFKTWGSRDFPKGYDSVKGVGSKNPDWKSSTDVGNLTIPTGKTVPHREFPSYELTYNEYFIYEASRITVRFAVDVEVTPVQGSSSEESSD